MVSTHVSGDYNVQNTNIIALSQMDFCPVDAYHGNADPVFIVDLMRRTAEFNNPFNKPVLITEFGGSHMGHGVKHLRETLHAALWASTCIPLGGAPMMWWWQLIEEEDFYPEYGAVARFMEGEDRRGAGMKRWLPELVVDGEVGASIGVECLRDRGRALGWIYRKWNFGNIDPSGEPGAVGLVMRFWRMEEGDFAVEFWDTLEGGMRERVEVVVGEDGVLTVAVPAFARDIAFKVRKVGPG
jgi:hypothetical protein